MTLLLYFPSSQGKCSQETEETGQIITIKLFHCFHFSLSTPSPLSYQGHILTSVLTTNFHIHISLGVG